MESSVTTAEGQTPFRDLAAYMAIPRVNAIRLSPDGTWLAAAVQTLNADKKKWVTSIWRIDTSGGEPHRLTRSAEGEGNPRFLPDGGLLFVSKRPDPDKTEQEDKPALWLLPAGGGEAGARAALPGGISEAEVAAAAGTVVLASPVLPAAGNSDSDTNDTPADDEKLRKQRKDAGVSAILHESVPVRYWDHDLGPAQLRLFALNGDDLPRDITPDAGRALFEPSFDVSPDGTQAAASWWQWQRGNAQSHSEIVLVDVKTGARRVLASDPLYSYENPVFSPDGRRVATVKSSHHTPERPHDNTLVVLDIETGEETDITAGLDRWPAAPLWSPDGATVYFTADDNGRHSVFKAAGGQVTKLTGDDGAYGNLQVATDGTLYALRAAMDEPPTPVRVSPATGEFTRLQAPGIPLTLPGHLTEITATADDGHPIRSWLVLPDNGKPADGQETHPLLLWVHGGPMMSWNSWSWRWNPWLMAGRGYAVLLPDPALSTGYGQEFIQRGYHEWGDRPFRDIMAATDAAVARDDIDETRTGMMGGSYGGYMANWIAGHTDRFGAIVSHAGLWVLDQMFGTTDMPMFWRPQFGDPLTSPEMYERNSPHRSLDEISTPMLVIHGDKDYRVPIGEALRLWWDLNRTAKDAKFLYFPDENHWILTPGNHTVWYETVYAFLGQHVLGEEWRRPELL
jgi:dipeptidyl aminopeptidase/acylaminoacyl peptidase